MERYIRTKNRIYELFGENFSSASWDEEGVLRIYYSDSDRGEYQDDMDRRGYSMDILYPDDIVDKSDNIEDLFDWIFLRKDGKIREVYKTYEDAVIAEGNDIVGYEVLGVIETDRGLIYVAKENEEEGELFKLL